MLSCGSRGSVGEHFREIWVSPFVLGAFWCAKESRSGAEKSVVVLLLVEIEARIGRIWMRFEEANLGRFKLFETVLCIIAEHEAPTDVAIAIGDDFAMLDSPKPFDFPDQATRLQPPLLSRLSSFAKIRR